MKKKILFMLLAVLTSMQAWSYRITDNYTIEVKFKINAVGAGIAFAGYEGYGGNICMWQFNVGVNGDRSLFRPHDWRVGGILLEEKGTGSVTLNTTDWFVATIVISNNGNHADTYLRKADDAVDVLIDSRDSRFNNEFRYGLVGARQDHDVNTNESATFDYIKITDESDNMLYEENFDETDGSWTNNPVWDSTAGTLTVEGRDLSERKYFPNNMFKDAVDMHYTVEADVTILQGYISLVFGIGDNGSNYMWQISPNYRNNGNACIYYHLDNGNENWKAHAAGPDFPDFNAEAFKTERHVMIKVDGNIVETYVDGLLQDRFVQCDMTDLERLNDVGGIGLRADGTNGSVHVGYVDNVKVTKYDADFTNPNVILFDNFAGGMSRYFDPDASATTSIESVNGDYKFAFNVAADKFRELQIAYPYPLFVSEKENNEDLPALEATDVTLQRTFKGGMWNTLCLPFALTAEQVKTILGDEAKVAALSTVDADNEIVKFETIDTGIEAGKPYLVMPTADISSEIKLTGIDIVGGKGQEAGQNGYTFRGTLKPVPFSAGDKTIFFVSADNKLSNPNKDGSLLSLRAYFDVPEGANEAKFEVDDPTGIKNVVVNGETLNARTGIYDLQGRKVSESSLAKGIYIINGKKVVLK